LITEIVTKSSSAVFIVMAVNTEVFPIRTIRRVIPGISILVVYCEEMSVFVIELLRALSTDEAVNLDRPFSVAVR
jgi:hypothetical protein